MKRGKVSHIILGIFEILLGFAFLAIIPLFFLYAIPIATSMTLAGHLFQSIFGISGDIIYYIPLALAGLCGILAITFGSITIGKCRKEAGEYYKRGGNLIFFFICETLALAVIAFLFYTTYMLYADGLVDLEIYLTSVLAVSAFVWLLRLVGMIMFFVGKKAHFKPASSAVSDTTPTGEKKDVATQLQELSALKELGEISEKEYLAKKANLLNNK